jgi:cell division protein FtsZ
MISYSRDPKQQIPAAAVKIIGLGGAGANMLERVALDNLEGGELLTLSTDIRALSASLAKEKIQLGTNLTKGLGTGGDPELGQQAVLEAETEIRAALKGQKIVFLCVGLGGGTGSGAAPIITRIAREEGAFVIVFATMPFLFEGQRRRDQAETALNQLAVLSNALVTFDNNRMGELVLAKQGIHEAFGAADKMIFESIKAVIRLVAKPGLIHVGLDELITALRTTRSRCLFGSGIADGKDRASKALRNALTSPLLDQGALLKEAQSVLVHLCGGDSLTLFEIELLMQALQKHVPEDAQILFGAAIDSSMGDFLSITLISSLPEEVLNQAPKNVSPAAIELPSTPPPVIGGIKEEPMPTTPLVSETTQVVEQPKVTEDPKPPLVPETPKLTPIEPIPVKAVVQPPKAITPASTPPPEEEPADSLFSELQKPKTATAENNDLPFAEPALHKLEPEPAPQTKVAPALPPSATPETQKPAIETRPITPAVFSEPKPDLISALKLKLGAKQTGDKEQDELSFKKVPRGRFEGESPNVIDGEDLDLPPFLRKKKT